MLCRPQIRYFAAWILTLATAFLPAAAQPNRDKNTWCYDGGIFLETDGAIPGGACFRVKGRVTAADFFENLKREDTNSGTLFRRANDIVTEFPKRLHLSMSISDIPCDPHMQQTNSRVYLTAEMISALRLNFFWKRALELRPVRGIVESGGEVRPVPNGRARTPRSRTDRRASTVNSGLSSNTVGRTWTTGTPDQFMTCSAR